MLVLEWKEGAFIEKVFKNESFITFHFLCFSCVIVKTIYSSYKTKFHAFVYFPVIIILVIINWQRLYCVVPENIHTPLPPPPPTMEDTFAYDHPPRWNFHAWGCLSYHPLAPGSSAIILLGWLPSGRNICVKKGVALYYYAKDNFCQR